MSDYGDSRLWLCPRCGSTWAAPAGVMQAACNCPSLHVRRSVGPPRRVTLMTDITQLMSQLTPPDPELPPLPPLPPFVLTVVKDREVFG